MSAAAAALADAFGAFAEAFPNAEAATAAGRAALEEAGFEPRPSNLVVYDEQHFAGTPDECRALGRALELWFPALDHCDPPELLGEDGGASA